MGTRVPTASLVGVNGVRMAFVRSLFLIAESNQARRRRRSPTADDLVCAPTVALISAKSEQTRRLGDD
jgi:hypothetical protein